MATAKPAKNKSSTQTEGRDARATNWSETETKALIAVWTDEDTQTATEDPFTRNKKIYRQISETLTRMGYNRTAKQVKNKIQSLKQKYKSVVYANNKSGGDRVEWEHFDAIDRVLGTRPAINPPQEQILESEDTTSNQPGDRPSHDDDLLDESGSQDSQYSADSDVSMVSDEEAEGTGDGEDVGNGQAPAVEREPVVEEDVGDPEQDAAVRATQGPEGLQAQGKRESDKLTKTSKSVNMMLKKFMDNQDQQDRRFMALEKQRAEEEKRRVESEEKMRREELAFAREQLQEQQRAREAREAREKRQDDMMNMIFMQMCGRHFEQPMPFNNPQPNPYSAFPAHRYHPYSASRPIPVRRPSDDASSSSQIASSSSQHMTLNQQPEAYSMPYMPTAMPLGSHPNSGNISSQQQEPQSETHNPETQRTFHQL